MAVSGIVPTGELVALVRSSSVALLVSLAFQIWVTYGIAAPLVYSVIDERTLEAVTNNLCSPVLWEKGHLPNPCVCNEKWRH
jgi:hypothetical protein